MFALNPKTTPTTDGRRARHRFTRHRMASRVLSVIAEVRTSSASSAWWLVHRTHHRQSGDLGRTHRNGGTAEVAQILSVPVFIVAVGLTRLLAVGLESIGLATLRPCFSCSSCFSPVF